MSRSKHHEEFANVINVFENISKRTGVVLFDPSNTLCSASKCIYEENGISLYKDKSHLSERGAKLLERDFLRALTEVDQARAKNKTSIQ